MPDPQPLLDFWFGNLTDGFADAGRRKKWFSGTAAFDAELTTHFTELVDAALRDELDAWLPTSRGTLAYILVCDQLTRNIHRGQSRAFAGDQRALAAAHRAVALGIDSELTPDERAFLYMPFEHSENLVDQHTCVGLFAELHELCTPATQPIVAGFKRFACQHRDIVRRFGRFPHRNSILGRASTPEETQFIATGPGFGQARASGKPGQ